MAAQSRERPALAALYSRENPRCVATKSIEHGSWLLVIGRCAAMQAAMFFHKDGSVWKAADCGLGDKNPLGSSPLTHCRFSFVAFSLARDVITEGFSPVSKGLRAASRARVQPEVVIRYVSDAEITAVINFGTVRGDRPGEHFATNDLYRDRSQARARLALPVEPSERLDMMVPGHVFSRSSTVTPLFGQPGGGNERIARPGRVPVIGIRVSPLIFP